MDTRPAPSDLWTYRGRANHVVDGDTIDVTIDAGFRNFREERLRILGVNTPETQKPTRAEGEAAKSYTLAWLVEAAAASPLDDWTLIIQTEKSDVFGRFLATIWRMSDGRCLNDDLIESGHARVDIRTIPRPSSQ